MIALVCVLALVAVASAAPSQPLAAHFPDGRIIGGWEARRGQFPYQISAQYCRSGSCSHSCGGSILSPTWILTAAHCITEVSGGTYKIVAGILNLDDDVPQKQERDVVESIVHPLYEGGVNPNDVGLWRLDSPLQYHTDIQPIPLPEAGANPTGEVILSGWGATGTFIIFPIMPNTLQTVDIPLIPLDECDAAISTILDGRPHPLDQTNNICTGPLTQSISACGGDSGGPLVQNGVLIGIVSWGITPCGTVGAPSVYGKVSYYTEWIRAYVTDIAS